ncbi:dopamine beta-hydroxylase-like [Asterias amurensis]|uniref:dopamine beta-hydroxylase-like n=1 Tax=Asterias amurensis TaxID=7602 RepID=UPI003AB5AC42
MISTYLVCLCFVHGFLLSMTDGYQHSNLPYHVLLVPEGEGSDRAADLSWAVDFEKETVDFRLSVPLINGESRPRNNREWFAFGMSPDGSLVKADLVVFCFPRGILKVTEAYTNSEGVMFKDGGNDDYVLLGSRVTGGGLYDQSPAHLEIDFRRQFDTCDRHDYQIDGGTVDLIYLRGNHSTISSGLINPEYADLASRRVQLLKSKRRAPPVPSDVKSADITMHNTEIPNQVTTYWCRVRKFPDVEDIHHIIKYESVITPGNEDVVHHMEVFHCVVPEGVEVPDYNGECEDEDQPSELEPCKRVIGAWAMGATAFSYPKEAGVPIGGSGKSSYVMLQVHYNNLGHREGVLDSSGIRFHYTPFLRPHDAGILEVGATYSPNLSVPPTSTSFYLTGYCAPDCTHQGIPREGIHVFASQLHTHLSGTGVWTKHVRNGVEIPELNRDNHYDSMFQEIRLLKEDVTVYPGDALITTCRYDTSSRRNTTLGGFGIQDEMCVNYMHYYPSSGLEVCKSTVSNTALDAFFTFVNGGKNNKRSEALSPAAVARQFQSITWTPSVKLLWQYVIDQAPIDMECLRSSGQPFHGDWKDRLPPLIKFPMAKRRRRCTRPKLYPFLRFR